MECHMIRNVFYRTNDNDKDKSKSMLFNDTEKCFYSERILKKIGTHSKNKFNYHGYENAYKKRLIIEQASTILRHNKINGDYLNYHSLKYFYQIMSATCFLIFLTYAISYFFLMSSIKLNEYILITVALTYLSMFIIIMTEVDFGIDNNGDRNIIISIINIILIFIFYIISEHYFGSRKIIFLVSFPCTLLFRELFIGTYKLYLGDVLSNYFIFMQKEDTKK